MAKETYDNLVTPPAVWDKVPYVLRTIKGNINM